MSVYTRPYTSPRYFNTFAILSKALKSEDWLIQEKSTAVTRMLDRADKFLGKSVSYHIYDVFYDEGYGSETTNTPNKYDMVVKALIQLEKISGEVEDYNHVSRKELVKEKVQELRETIATAMSHLNDRSNPQPSADKRLDVAQLLELVADHDMSISQSNIRVERHKHGCF